MQHTFKRFLSTLLVLVMVLTMVPVLGHTTASATETGAAESTNTTEPEYKVNWNFEDGETKGTNKDNGLSVFQTEDKDGNHVLHVGSDGSSNAYWVIDNSVIGSQSKITITYNIAIGDTSKITYFPAPIPSDQYTGQYIKVRNWVTGELQSEQYGKTAQALLNTKAKQWYTVKMFYDKAEQAGYVEIDGERFNVSTSNNTTRNIARISMRFQSGYANDAYLDNVRVTVGDVDHDAAVPTACLCENGPIYTDGKCTGCGAHEQPALKFSNASLVLQDNLAINFKADASLFEDGGYSDPYAVFTFNNKSYTVDDYTIDTAKGKYVFNFTDIAPHMMGDKITYTLYATSDNDNKVVTGTSGTYSVLDYCTDALGKTDVAALQTLLVDTLNYGAAAQTHQKYNQEALVNAGLTPEQQASTLTRELKNHYKEEGDVDSAVWDAAALLLDDAITVRLKFTAGSQEEFTVKIGTVEHKSVYSGMDGEKYVYYVDFPLTPKQLSDEIKAQVFNGETSVSNTLTFSAESYAFNKANDANVNLAALVKAMMKYGDSAKAYADSLIN